MITLEFAQTMARYNRWQNRSLVQAADSLTDQDRWLDRGAFFRSIAETLNHILWDDRVWMARLQRDEATTQKIADRHPYTDAPRIWSDFKRQRATLDETITDWTTTLTEPDLAKDISWVRGNSRVQTNFGFNLAHMINHQTHHRGQVHAMLTQAGAVPEATDLQMLDVEK